MNSLPRYFPALDGLRGIAITLVLVYHFVARLNPNEDSFTLIESVLAVGWCGVDLFFVLSGFLITRILLEAKTKPHFFKNFYARRTLRIFPAYYGFLFVSLILLPVLFKRHLFELGDDSLAIYSLWLYFCNFYMGFTSQWLPNGLSHLWSLAIEEQFYLVWPLLVYFIAKKRLFIIALVLMVLAFVIRIGMLKSGAHPLSVYVLPFTRMDTLLAGAALALWLKLYSIPKSAETLAKTIALLSTVALAGVLVYQGDCNPFSPYSQQVGFSLLIFIFTPIVFLAIYPNAAPLFKKLLSNSFLQLIGKYSYFIYIVHHPLLGALAFFGLMPLTGYEFVDFIFYFMIVLATGHLSWHVFEKHFIKLKKHFVS